MANLFLLLLCMFIGMLLKRFKRLPENTPAVLNAYVIHIALPALTLLHLHRIRIDGDSLYPILMSWTVFALAALFFILVVKHYEWSKPVLGALLLTTGFGNTSFVGFPLLEALYGPDALAIGVLTDQPGTFLALSTVGLLAASLCSQSKWSVGTSIRRIISFPPLYALILALILEPIDIPPLVRSVLSRLSDTLVPMALISVGFQLKLNPAVIKKYRGKLAAGLAFKLILAPLGILTLFTGILGQTGEAAQITVTQAAMAPMITGAVVAEDYGLAPELSALLLGIGIPLSFITVPLWAELLRRLLGT